jgi:Lipocalin-like domain
VCAPPMPLEPLLGTWKLVSAVREEIPSGAKVDLFGQNPVGYLNYAPDGRMLALIVRGERVRPAGASATPGEAEALFRSMLSYGGTYTIDGNEVTHHVDIAWNESWSGGAQKRTFTFEGDRLHLATSASPDPAEGKMSVRRMVWERVA